MTANEAHTWGIMWQHPFVISGWPEDGEPNPQLPRVSTVHHMYDILFTKYNLIVGGVCQTAVGPHAQYPVATPAIPGCHSPPRGS